MRLVIGCLALLALGGCASPPPRALPPEPLSAKQEPDFEEKPVPSFEDWIELEINAKDREPDLVLAATVLASHRSGHSIASSKIARWLNPILKRTRARTGALSSPNERLDVLVAELVPVLQSKGPSELRWLHESLGADEGPCAVNSLMFLIAGDELGLKLEPILIPSHVLVSHQSEQKRRHIETTDQGQHWSIEEYRMFLLRTPTSLHQLAETPEALAKAFRSVHRRHFLAMLLCQGAGKRKDGLADLELAARLAPDSHLPAQKLGGYHATLNDFALAEDYMSRAITLAPHLPGLLSARASNRVLLSKYEAAIQDVEAALRMAPHVPRYHQTLGLAYFRARRFEEAQKAFSRAADGAPREAEYQIFNAMALEKLEKYAEAIEACTTAIQLHPKKAEYYRRRSKLWAIVGDEARFKADLETAKELGSAP